MNLWLDDARHPGTFLPQFFGVEYDDTWIWAETADDAIEALKTQEFKVASLDHDLADEHYPWNSPKGEPESGYREKTGYDVVLWMAEFDVWPSESLYIHTANGVGLGRMSGVVKRYGPFRRVSAREYQMEV